MAEQKDKPSETDLYASYVAIFNMPFGTHFKQRALESLALQIRQWVVTHISVAAVKHIKETKKTVGLRRGHHVMDRIERARSIFKEGGPLKEDDFIKFFFDSDHVTLVVKAEANFKGTSRWSPKIEVPSGRFKQRGSYAIAATSSDIEWVMSLDV